MTGIANLLSILTSPLIYSSSYFMMLEKFMIMLIVFDTWQ